MFVHYIDLAWRSLRQTPMVTFLMILAIAIGIGVTMTTLSVYHMMSMDPIPHKSDRLFAVQLQTMDDGETWLTDDDIPYQLTYPDAINLQALPGEFARAAMIRAGFSVHLNTPRSKPFIENARVTGRDFFSMFDLTFIHGGAWTEAQSRDAAPVVVIDEEMAQQLFGKTDVVGESLFLGERRQEIVGVTQKWRPTIKFYDLNNGSFGKAERLFVPFSHVKAYDVDTWGNTNGWKFEETRDFNDKMNSEMLWIQFWVQLDTPQQRQAFGDMLMAYMQQQQNQGRFNRDSLAYSLQDVNAWMNYNDVISEDNKILVGLSFMFLAVCVANILGLLLAKFMRRAADVGVRRALGASKRQVFYQHLVEVGLLGLLGGTLGVLFAQLGLLGVRQTYNYYEGLANMDWVMLLSAPAIAISACILAGLYPAWLVCRTTPATHLKVQ
ncbi:putative ABC transport system permease protein [Pseudoalteromonas rubra]|uniref:Putative ABC transport system permease protein n=1 Tax=Pseudoalteromonas rubra TaxID=43658 RepID=A0A8T0C1Y8_9GAMM|nr:ABC transporter permease [Pseudoalteromonas rubra]KAF7781674.1 putative ABC transport system permease protein [Pseudoalteromonas rubra]